MKSGDGRKSWKPFSHSGPAITGYNDRECVLTQELKLILFYIQYTLSLSPDETEAHNYFVNNMNNFLVASALSMDEAGVRVGCRQNVTES